MGYAFISYSSTQQRQLDRVKEYLRSNGISFWAAPEDIPIGSKYSEVIKRAIENASCVLFLLSERSQNSTYCKLEVALALKLEKPIIPIQLEDVILNDDFALYLSTSEIYPLPRKITNAKTNKLLSQLKLLCADPDQGPVEPAEPADPSYKIGWFRKGTWLQIFGWVWVIGGGMLFSILADLCFPVPPLFPSFTGDGLDSWTAPIIAEMTFRGDVLVTALQLIGWLAVCYGFSLNRKKYGQTYLFFRQFSLCQILLLMFHVCFGISVSLEFLVTINHLDHYYSSFWVDNISCIFDASFYFLYAALGIWLFGRLRWLYLRWKNKKQL